jgi:hypothetical protein
MEKLLYTAAGACLLLLIAFDVYATVLHSSARYGPIGERLNRLVWRSARAVAFRLSRPSRHRLLNVVGPLLMPLLVTVFVVTLIAGFALIYYPRMPEQFTLAREVESSDFMNAAYFSGVTLTSVGYGDIAPRTTAMRITAIFECVSGLGLISLAIAYLLTIYRALERKRTAALAFYHQAGEGADAAGYIAYYFVEGRFYGLREELRAATRDIQELLEAHVEHPVIHYFHPVEVYKGLPRVLFLMLEVCTVIRTSLDMEEYSDLRNFPEVRVMEANTRQVLHELFRTLDLERRRRRHGREEERPFDDSRWERRYLRNQQRLAEVGIKIRPDHEAGFSHYRDQRKEWESKLQRFSNYLGYDWDEVTGDTDPEYASDEEKQQPRQTPAQDGTEGAAAARSAESARGSGPSLD